MINEVAIFNGDQRWSYRVEHKKTCVMILLMLSRRITGSEHSQHVYFIRGCCAKATMGLWYNLATLPVIFSHRRLRPVYAQPCSIRGSSLLDGGTLRR